MTRNLPTWLNGIIDPTRQRALLTVATSLLVVAFLAQGFSAAVGNSMCNDESKHIVTGWWLLQHREACLGIDNSPLTAVFALPLLGDQLSLPRDAAETLNPHEAGYQLIFTAPDPEWILLRARAVMLLLGACTVLLAGMLSRRLFGPAGQLLTVCLVAFDPNLIAHFSVVSTDALLVFTTILYVVALDGFLRTPTRRGAAGVGICLGIALIAKYTSLVLLPATGLLLPFYLERLRKRPVKQWGVDGCLALVAALAVVWVGYGAHITTAPPFLPIPGFLAGLGRVRSLAAHGMPSYLCGQVSTSWRSYFLYVLALKTPVPLLLLWGIAVVAGAPGTRRAFLVPTFSVPALAAVFYTICLASDLNLGVRHMLPCYALMAIFTGGLAPWLVEAKRRSPVRALTGVLVLWLAGEAMWMGPHHLAYFNQFAGGPTGAIRYLGDSNLDWGQDLKRLRTVMDENGFEEAIVAYLGNTDPAFYGITYQCLPVMFYGSTNGDRVVSPQREILAVSTSNLQGIHYDRPDPFAWLTERPPIARAGYSIYLYDITGDAAAHRELAGIYAQFGMHGLQARELAKAGHPGRARNPRPSPLD
ncbi:MAG: phospholipid carrier-dependent glycosyltransferase [Lentisphaerae bacterium]|jgi:hypothetical protein|nr:phospholipid carrier-dependent glycosyltransferase [Lentisphaerota bacterium]MBT4823394.1 phospholipid carrier-dependent glycosyltransferase [Lentisphaerota bacterium]MBT5606244.1 phospholipid carrier-dependent glycosyltransferase [Lentisphaerota bacterium]MBT7054071.1 phospholipid carrier-dependent glycosyltransferase [Lentisphaerota bacterium]MBT7845110.1 phospholipid carrier-dependent glycosyltransferase [Lentisphaerota bacterium]